MQHRDETRHKRP